MRVDQAPNLLNIGSRVRAIRNIGYTYDDNIGQIGTVRRVKALGQAYGIGVEFDNYVGGHDLDGLAIDGHGWYCQMSGLEYVSDQSNEPLLPFDAILSGKEGIKP